MDTRSSLPYYKVDIELNVSDISADRVSNSIPACAGQVFIETGERSFARYVLSPLFTRVQRGLLER